MPLLQDKTSLGFLFTGLGAALLITCAYEPAWWEGMVAGAVLMAAGGVILWREAAISVTTVLFGAIAVRLLLFPLPPLLSDDAYRYIWDGLVQLEGLNPYLFTPSDAALRSFRELWIYPLLNSTSYYTVYPPISQFVYTIGALFYVPGTLSSYYVIKAIVVGCDLAAIYFLSRVVDARSLMLYAWHPLILLEFAGQAHQEAIMVLFLILSWWFLERGRGRSAVAALTAAGWVKLYPFLLLPFLLRRTNWKHIWVSAAVTMFVWLPYADLAVLPNVLSSLQLYVQLFEFNAGPYYAAKQLMYIITGADWSKTLGPLFAGSFITIWAGAFLVDARFRWRWPAIVVGILGSYLALATTVHPWYLTGVLAMVPLLQRKSSAWLWLGLWSIGTYLFYEGGPYWSFIWIGWGGWFILIALHGGRRLLDGILRMRAEKKWEYVAQHIPNDTRRMLDLGAGEGYVGARAADAIQGSVQLADVRDLNRTGLPYTVYDGKQIPFQDDAFDVTMLVYVLHHAAKPRQVLEESCRVTSQRVVVLESVYESMLDRWVLAILDRLANGFRFFEDRLTVQHVDLRTADEWEVLLKDYGKLIHEERFGEFPHKKALYVLEPKP